MEHCDGEIPAKRPKLSDDVDAGGGEDRLSALPDDVLIHILLKLRNANVAARTSVLSNRWRSLWTLLPDLSFPPANDSQRIHLALTAHGAPVLRRLSVGVMDSTPESVATWLPIAARRLCGGLLLINCVTQNGSEVMAGESGAFQLPFFQNATSIRLELGGFGVSMPPSGVFARLIRLFLAWIRLTGPCMLGDVVSSSRCPVLQRLTVQDVWGIGNFIIHSDTLLEVELKHLHDLQQLTVMAPALKLLTVRSCFAERSRYNQPVANISAPLLVSLFWKDAYDPRFTQFGKMENLKWLATKRVVVYGKVGSNSKLYNSSCMEILRRRWRCIQNLRVVLVFPTDVANCEYLMEDITRLPNIRNLALDIMAKGHSCGASLYHVLRMCTGVIELYLTLLGTMGSPEAQTACPSGCVSDQPPNWKTDELVLNRLRKVRIHKLRGTENEAGFVKRIFDWATVLETMTVTFDCSVAESKAKEFCQMLQSYSGPGVCLKGPHFP